jgi:hypothetical protein
LIKEKRHDVYRADGKWPEPTVCIRCGAVFASGRWTWQEAPAAANEVVCPACRRIIDRYPAGAVEIEGSFFENHLDEILNLIRNVAEQEQSEHPLERIMTMTGKEKPILVTTTGLHLARRIGEALSRAYKGELSCQYLDEEQRIKVHWQR